MNVKNPNLGANPNLGEITVCIRSLFLRFISKTKHLHKNCDSWKTSKLSFLPIKSVFIIEFHEVLEVKIAKI